MLKRLVLAAAAGLMLVSGAQAATYDAFASFDGVQGSGGFRYLNMGGAGATPTLLSTSGSCVVTSDFCLQDGAGLPGAYKSLTAFDELTYTVPDDRLLMHPGSSSAIGVFFTAPVAGVYDFTASFNILDRAPTGVAIIRITNADGAPTSTILGGIGAAIPALVSSGTVALDQGEFLAFVINNAGNYANDSVGFNFTLTSGAVPEPATWAMMILGFGGAGALLRRRSAVMAG